MNLVEELARLRRLLGSGRREPPRFTYAPAQDHGDLRRAMDAAAERLAGQGELGAVYAGRASELAAEAAICEAAGGAGCWPRRAPPLRSDAFDEQADALAATWVEQEAGAASSDEAGAER